MTALNIPNLPHDFAITLSFSASKRYVYIWADGIYAKVRLEDHANKKQCMLVLMGATGDGQEELIAVVDADSGVDR